jgi:hypothetical protein
MGPGAIFRRLNDIAKRRPKLIGAIGFALVAEGMRVIFGLKTATTVILLGHSGLTAHDVVADRPFLSAYAGWVAVAGIVVLSFARRGARAAAREARGRRLAAAREAGLSEATRKPAGGVTLGGRPSGDGVDRPGERPARAPVVERRER